MDVVREWTERISELLSVIVLCSQSVYALLVRCANHLRQRSHAVRGGSQRRKFFGKMWTFHIPSGYMLKNLECANSELKAKVDTLTRELSVASELLKKVDSNASGPRGRRKCCHTSKHYSQRHERRLKRQRAESCSASLAWMEEVLALNTRTKETETIDLKQSLEGGLQLTHESLDDDQADIVSMMLHVKDKHQISGLAYHEMAKLCQQMPRHYRLKNKISELNKLWDIRPSPNGIIGVQQSLLGRLLQRIHHLVSETPPNHRLQSEARSESETVQSWNLHWKAAPCH